MLHAMCGHTDCCVMLALSPMRLIYTYSLQLAEAKQSKPVVGGHNPYATDAAMRPTLTMGGLRRASLQHAEL